ncbi:tRNA pseudouridine synthase A [uncultured Amnibacterium sp.]|uniref:tRNA pseudouridine synthase A n=1 Tax=uncultured Amnibacterium sp. TaxID=1631851 RepID=UPI0035CB41C6
MQRPTDEDFAIRLRLDIAYDGTDFHGWARQAGDQRTVQGRLEQALGTAARSPGQPPRPIAAGRTDAGVHATGQVAHLDLTAGQAESLLRRVGADGVARRVNGVLGADGDLVVRASALAPAGFDARFSAIWRRYEYRIADAEAVLDPLQRRRTLVVPRRMDDAAIVDASAALTGLHDFAAFCRPRPFATTIRTLQSLSWAREDDGVLVARLQADAFCHGMVRSIVGACLAVSTGRLRPDGPARLLSDAVRSGEYPVAPARGLTLTEVGYPPDAELADRAEHTRALRVLATELSSP